MSIFYTLEWHSNYYIIFTMKSEFYLNPGFSELKIFVSQIPDLFDNIGDPIHMKRNEVRRVDVKGQPYVIKYYKKITVFNRLIYSFIRKPKSRRAYEHSAYLLRNQITSPEPVAYINSYRFGMLHKSYYMCRYTDYKPFKELLSMPVSESRPALEAFARFSYLLHKSGIYHGDYSTSNVLYQSSGNHYDFSLIDNNRMKIGKYNYAKGMRSMKRLEIPLECMGIIAEEYAKVSKIEGIRVLYDMTLFRLISRQLHTIKQLVKCHSKM